MKESLKELKNNYQTYSIAREQIEEFAKSSRKNTPRSSTHIHFLLERPPESTRIEKIV